MNRFCASEHNGCMLTFLKVICHTLDAHDVKGKVITWDFALLKFTLGKFKCLPL